MTFLSGFGIVTIVLVSVCALQIVGNIFALAFNFHRAYRLFLDGVPLIYENNDFNKFEDAWDYKIQPHSEPLLDDAPRNHTLPPEGKIVSILFRTIRFIYYDPFTVYNYNIKTMFNQKTRNFRSSSYFFIEFIESINCLILHIAKLINIICHLYQLLFNHSHVHLALNR